MMFLLDSDMISDNNNDKTMGKERNFIEEVY